MSRQRCLVRLILDFDGTVTKKDTMHLVAKAGYDRQTRKHPPNSVPSWQDIVSAYKADYDQHTETYRPVKWLRTKREEEFMFLNSLKDVENASAQRVYQAGIFDDVTAADVESVALEGLRHGQIQLRSGWQSLVKHVLSRNHQALHSVGNFESIQVISVNWSGWFIQSILHHAVQEMQSTEEAILNNISIYANEIPSVISDLKHKPNIETFAKDQTIDFRTAGDKLIPLLNSKSQPKPHQDNVCSIYIGDSTTDLQCLTTVDIGICMRDQPMGSSQKDLADVCARLGIHIRHISEKLAVREDSPMHQDTNQSRLWWCRNFDEVLTWLEDHPV